MSETDEQFEEGLASRILRKVQKNSIPAIGATVFLTIAGIGAYKYKRMGTKTTPSLFLLQLRVAAQGTVIALLTGIMVYHLVDDFVLKDKKK